MVQLAKQVYRFGKDIVEGNGSMGNLLGGKGAGLTEMTLLSVPVPPGFTITTDVCRDYLEHGELVAELKPEVNRCLLWLEQQSGKRLGDSHDPLLVSVRSGAPISMPGMMDTVLNVGLNDKAVQGLAKASGSQIFALDSYRRLLQMFGSVVLGVSKQAFEESVAEIREGMLKARDQMAERELTMTIDCFKKVIYEHTGSHFPQDPSVQLFLAVEAVFRSWRSDRAVFYRKLSGIAETLSGVAETALTTGLPASPGAAVGILALSANAAVAMHANGDPVILLTEETTADDIHGMDASVGFLIARGGATSHAAVVARGMGKCCITGARDIAIDSGEGRARIGAQTFKQGDWISLDGSPGCIFAGKLPLRPASEDHPELDDLLQWARDVESCKVRANADTPADAHIAMTYAAAGIGLCRTEHMFFAAGRLQHVRAMIMASTIKERVAALERLLPIQRGDFEALFRTMSPQPVTIRLLDPPLHEFLPSGKELALEIAAARNEENWEHCLSLQAVQAQLEALSETNPMMGHRGCRLSLTYPEILRMQVSAILQAAIAVAAEGYDPHPEIMVPLVSSEQEMRVLAGLIHATAAEIFETLETCVDYKIGTMIELPRAAVCAGPIAKHVSFISFGTNDLTQMTYGFSRDDARSYLDSYIEQGIFKTDPFITIDRDGVGELMRMAILNVRRTNPSIKIDICGEHGGDPESIAFFQQLGLDYVSCSPSRLLVAQLAVAQAALANRKTSQSPELALAS